MDSGGWWRSDMIGASSCINCEIIGQHIYDKWRDPPFVLYGFYKFVGVARLVKLISRHGSFVCESDN